MYKYDYYVSFITEEHPTCLKTLSRGKFFIEEKNKMEEARDDVFDADFEFSEEDVVF